MVLTPQALGFPLSLGSFHIFACFPAHFPTKFLKSSIFPTVSHGFPHVLLSHSFDPPFSLRFPHVVFLCFHGLSVVHPSATQLPTAPLSYEPMASQRSHGGADGRGARRGADDPRGERRRSCSWRRRLWKEDY